MEKVGKDIVYISIAKEPHEDGSPHFHGYCYWLTKHHCRTIVSRLRKVLNVHPNIQGNIRYPRAAAQYVRKGGNFIEDGRFEELPIQHVG